MSTREQRKRRQGRKFYTNKPEDLAACKLDEHRVGFNRRGYPDFTVYNSDGSVYGFIEVKPNRNTELKKPQQTFQNFCTSKGIPCIRWSPDEGVKKIEKFLESRK